MIIGNSHGTYPYGVEFNPDSPRPITVWEGRCGQELVSATLTLEEALQRRFEKYFFESGSMWFLKEIPKMISGKTFTLAELKIMQMNASGGQAPIK
jgi:hypothetical protein